MVLGIFLRLGFKAPGPVDRERLQQNAAGSSWLVVSTKAPPMRELI